jgi:hypothetical protein
MIAHGLKHGRTLDGTARWFKSIGARENDLAVEPRDATLLTTQ